MSARLNFDFSRFDGRMKAVSESVMRASRNLVAAGVRDVQLEARGDHDFTTRTGAAEQAIYAEAKDLRGVVRLDTGRAAYVTFLHQGTGIHGPNRRPIRARNGGMLRFEIGGQVIFRREVQGMRGDQFLYRAADRYRPRFVENVRAGISRALKVKG